jgi:hypothetical protein
LLGNWRLDTFSNLVFFHRYPFILSLSKDARKGPPKAPIGAQPYGIARP